MKKYKVIFLDWNGTLSSSKFWGHLEDPKHPKNHIFLAIEKSLFGNFRHLISPWMRGEKTSEEMVKLISDDAGLNYDLAFKEFVKGCKKMKFVSNKVPKIVHEYRKHGIKMVIATDNMDSFSRWTVPALKLDKMFDDILDSSSLKKLKNDFEPDGSNFFFTNYLKKNGIKPDESIIIDDSDDKEGKIQKYGIDYLKIESHTGLMPAFDKLAT